MATIDLGKIKQVFRGTYNNATAYVPDDLVVFTDTGITSTYICTTASTGNNPSSGGTAHANWAYLAKGVADPIPTQSGQSGKFLTTNGSALSFGSVQQNFTNTAIFQYSHNSSFRSYQGEISFSGNPDNVQIQFNMVYDAGDILAASGSNYFSVNATGYYLSLIHI